MRWHLGNMPGIFSLLQAECVAAVKAAGMLWHLADTLHLDRAQIWVIPRVNAVFDVAFNHGRPSKGLEVQLVVFPDGRRMRRA